jgi:transcriptional regulator with XRE-family HTH domain
MAAMEARGTDGAHLASAVGVTKQFVSYLLRGRRRCNAIIAADIAKELGIPLDDLFTTDNVSDFSNNTEDSMTLSAVDDDDPILFFEDVAELCKIKPKTLRHMRAVGEGPPFSRRGIRGRLRIRKSEALAWYRATFETAE